MKQYYEWAKEQLDPNRQHSIYDWSQMTLAETADRALAICEMAKDGSSDTPLIAFECLENMAKAIKEKYPYRRL